MTAELLVVISGVASAIAVIITSLRRRKDVDVDEMQRRIQRLEERLQSAEDIIQQLRSKLIATETANFHLRHMLAQHGIPTPPGAGDTDEVR